MHLDKAETVGETTMKPIHTMLIMSLVAEFTALLIVWGLRVLHAPAWLQLGILVFAAGIGALCGALCWAAKMGEDAP